MYTSLSPHAKKINHLLFSNQLNYDDLDDLPCGKHKILKFGFDHRKNLYVAINENSEKLYKLDKNIDENFFMYIYQKIVNYQSGSVIKKFFPRTYTYGTHLDLLKQIEAQLEK